MTPRSRTLKRRTFRAWWALALLCACAHGEGTSSQRPAPDSRDDWREYRSAHFLLDTDVGDGQAAILIDDLEHTFALILKALLGEVVEIPGRVRVVNLSQRSLFRELSPDPEIGGYFMQSSNLGEPVIVMPSDGFRTDPETIAHELAHHVTWFLFPRQPAWFSEGIASFAGTVANDEEVNQASLGSHIIRGPQGGTRGRVGTLPGYQLQALARRGIIPSDQLLGWDGDPHSDSQFHLSSWLLYHWLWNNRSKGLQEFQKRLMAAEDPDAAWVASFPEFNPRNPAALSALDELVDGYRREARYLFYQVKADFDAAHTSAPLSSADVAALLYEIRASKRDDDASRRELEQVLAQDATQPLALAARARLDKQSAALPLGKAVVDHPGDWRAWYLLGAALPAEAAKEKEAALRKAVALNVESAPANNSLAWLLLMGGHAQEALPFANQAVDLAPWSPAALDTLAAVVAELKHCPEALLLQKRALGLIRGEDPGMQTRLNTYLARCGPGVPHP